MLQKANLRNYSNFHGNPINPKIQRMSPIVTAQKRLALTMRTSLSYLTKLTNQGKKGIV
jgi:hypothetical protein